MSSALLKACLTLARGPFIATGRGTGGRDREKEPGEIGREGTITLGGGGLVGLEMGTLVLILEGMIGGGGLYGLEGVGEELPPGTRN